MRSYESVARPEVCAQAAGASARFEKLSSTGRREPVASFEVCARAARLVALLA